MSPFLVAFLIITLFLILISIGLSNMTVRYETEETVTSRRR